MGALGLVYSIAFWRNVDMDKNERLLKIIKRYRDELQKKIRERQYEM